MRFIRTMALLALFLFPATPSTGSTYEICPAPEVAAIKAKTQMREFIKTINPGLPDEDVAYIAKILEEKATEYDLDLVTFASVVAQESSFRLNLSVCHGAPGNCDLGLGQISSQWVKKWKLDVNRLRYDITYNLDVSAKLLKSVYTDNPTDKRAYSRYFNPDYPQRAVYEKRIELLKKIAASQTPAITLRKLVSQPVKVASR